MIAGAADWAWKQRPGKNLALMYVQGTLGAGSGLAMRLLSEGVVPFGDLLGEPIGLEDVARTLRGSGPKHPVVP